jgi:hypothetical protein
MSSIDGSSCYQYRHICGRLTSRPKTSRSARADHRQWLDRRQPAGGTGAGAWRRADHRRAPPVQSWAEVRLQPSYRLGIGDVLRNPGCRRRHGSRGSLARDVSDGERSFDCVLPRRGAAYLLCTGMSAPDKCARRDAPLDHRNRPQIHRATLPPSNQSSSGHGRVRTSVQKAVDTHNPAAWHADDLECGCIACRRNAETQIAGRPHAFQPADILRRPPRQRMRGNSGAFEAFGCRKDADKRRQAISLRGKKRRVESVLVGFVAFGARTRESRHRP